MFNQYYQQELQNLRELAQEFSRAHPAVAPLLSGSTADPDVERVLEGVAFLTGLLHRKIDDDFPEIIHGLTDVLFPHYLRPFPSASIVLFSPKQGVKETIRVPAGSSLASIPVEGTKCLFRTCFDTEAHPLRVTGAELVQKTGQPACIHLRLILSGQNLTQWQPERLGFLVNDDYATATDLTMLLARYTTRITAKSGADGSVFEFPPQALIMAGLEPDNCLLPFPPQALSGYRLFQEYFLLPQKFLFLELRGWENWKNRGTGAQFELIFELKRAPFTLPRVKPDQFVLSAVPVINLFTDDSDQVLLDHRTDKIRIRSSRKSKAHYQVYSVDKVVGFEQGSVTRKEYLPLELFSRHGNRNSIYQVVRTRSPIDDSPEVFLSFAYPPEGPPPEPETLSLTLTYTNGTLPERLQLGDISQQTSTSPGLLEFRNIIPPTSPVEPLLGENTLWKLLSHLSLNFLSVANADTLRELLRLYIFPEGGNRSRAAANLKRIESIQDLRLLPADRIVNGAVMRGQRIELILRQDHFASTGDLLLFGAMMDSFFGVYSSMNTFIQFTVKESITGETYIWPARLGERPLI